MKRSITGIKPTGTPHLGNYLGMIRPALVLTAETDATFFVADYHALTTVRDPARLHALTAEVAATLVALGLEPNDTPLYRQSDIPEVCELTWLLGSVTAKGLMNRAHAYKAAVQENGRSGREVDAGITMGLFGYPLLMAADILIHGAQLVPVGADNRQHIEVARDIATAFNTTYGEVFTLPDAVVSGPAMLVPGIDGRKMSKSYGNVIPILAPPQELRKRVARIVTDSRTPREPKDPGTCNVFAIYKHFASDHDNAAVATRYREGGIGYGEVKALLADALELAFADARARYEDVINDGTAIAQILDSGAERARPRAREMLARVRQLVGLA